MPPNEHYRCCAACTTSSICRCTHLDGRILPHLRTHQLRGRFASGSSASMIPSGCMQYTTIMQPQTDSTSVNTSSIYAVCHAIIMLLLVRSRKPMTASAVPLHQLQNLQQPKKPRSPCALSVHRIRNRYISTDVWDPISHICTGDMLLHYLWMKGPSLSCNSTPVVQNGSWQPRYTSLRLQCILAPKWDLVPLPSHSSVRFVCSFLVSWCLEES